MILGDGRGDAGCWMLGGVGGTTSGVGVQVLSPATDSEAGAAEAG
jgi:hypothetical protein